MNWIGIQKFIRYLNSRESKTRYVFRLPTEAEWEYAARAGTTGPRYGELDAIAWHGGYNGDGDFRPRPGGQKQANAWGLHDMLGNLWEYTADRWGEYSADPVTDPKRPVTAGGS